MMNRRQLAQIFTGLAGALGSRAATAKPVYADPMPGDKFKFEPGLSPPFDPVTIGMRFEYGGRPYGLRVPVLGEIEDYGNGDRVVIMSDQGVGVLIRMLQDLRWSRAETLRMLQAGELK